jgi:hypothetical protein
VDTEAESLLALIHEAFRGVPRGELSIHQAHIVKWTDEKRLRETGDLDRDRNWTEIADETIEQVRNALYGADPISWRYFVPAYMCWTLRNFKDSGSFICDQTIYTFRLHDISDPLRQDSVLRFDTLSLQQKRCICVFLRYMAKYPGHCDAEAARQSIESYWGQFVPGFTA